MSRKAPLFAVCCFALALAGCATTSFVSTWKAPDAKPLTFQPGEKVIALVVAKEEALRRSSETYLAQVLDRAGLKGVPGYTLVSGQAVGDESRAKQVIDASGAVGVVVIRPLGKEKEISSSPTGYYGGPYYGGFYGGYWGHGWGGAWGGYEVRTDTYVFIETLIYDLRQNKLVWAGKSQTMNPSEVQGFIDDVAKAVSAELQKAGLVPPKK